MSAFRVAFDVQDDLRDYASDFIARGMPMGSVSRLIEVENVSAATIERQGRFQVELCCVRGGSRINDHTHPQADTIEVGLTGGVRLFVNGIDPFAAVPDDRLPRFTRARGIRINATDLHGGIVLPQGAMFLSIQRWLGEPQSVLVDYVGAPAGSAHARVIL